MELLSTGLDNNDFPSYCRVVAGSSLVGVSTSGCLNRPGYYGGFVEALRFRSAPDGANVVDATDDRIVDIDPIQEAIRQVIDPEIKVDARTFVGKVEVSRREYAEVADALQSLSWFDRFDSDYPSGYYIRAGDVLANVTLTPFCRDVSVRRE